MYNEKCKLIKTQVNKRKDEKAICRSDHCLNCGGDYICQSCAQQVGNKGKSIG